MINEELDRILKEHSITETPEQVSNGQQTAPSNEPMTAEEFYQPSDFGDYIITDSEWTPTDNYYDSWPSPTPTAANPTPTDTPKERHYSKFTPIDCEEYTPPEWVIEDLFSVNTLNMIYGEPKSGKTNTVLDMAFHVATPVLEKWNGHYITHGHVAYFALEGADGIKKRLKVWRDKYGIMPDEMDIDIFTESFKFDGTDPDHTIEKTIAEITEGGKKPVLIVVDTLNRAMAGDENSTKDATNIIEAFTRIQRETGAAVNIIHHSGHTGTHARGSSVFYGNFDNMFRVEKNSEGQIVFIHEFSKDEATHSDMVFDIETRDTGWKRKNGSPVTSCTIEFNEEETTKRRENRLDINGTKAPKKSRTTIAKETFAETVKEHGEVITDTTNSTSYITLSEIEPWGNLFKNQIIEAAKKGGKTTKEDSKEKAFYRARKRLVEELKILTVKEINDHECYFLKTDYTDETLSGATLESLIKQRQEKEAQTERTGEIFKDKEITAEAQPEELKESATSTPQTAPSIPEQANPETPEINEANQEETLKQLQNQTPAA